MFHGARNAFGLALLVLVFALWANGALGLTRISLVLTGGAVEAGTSFTKGIFTRLANIAGNAARFLSKGSFNAVNTRSGTDLISGRSRRARDSMLTDGGRRTVSTWLSTFATVLDVDLSSGRADRRQIVDDVEETDKAIESVLFSIEDARTLRDCMSTAISVISVLSTGISDALEQEIIRMGVASVDGRSAVFA